MLKWFYRRLKWFADDVIAFSNAIASKLGSCKVPSSRQGD
jgi:hypothetical protein